MNGDTILYVRTADSSVCGEPVTDYRYRSVQLRIQCRMSRRGLAFDESCALRLLQRDPLPTYVLLQFFVEKLLAMVFWWSYFGLKSYSSAVARLSLRLVLVFCCCLI